MLKKTGQRLLMLDEFDDNLVDQVVRSNDDSVFMLALERPDCPAELLVDLSQAVSAQVRRGVAAHPNTPLVTLRRMVGDKDGETADIASRRLL